MRHQRFNSGGGKRVENMDFFAVFIIFSVDLHTLNGAVVAAAELIGDG